ncbi:hypothetical protein CBR_g50318 [Chara braunii]|uniref:Uncharacterized protein n=1 Tax=Chara braunii TaxID=69332 RepID=A0A388K5I5_CHABU|nr:hypothetical protein CBR_g50318 [Chara braunii]|eukprot:GBG65276.1 hypothetical protein CBR_g50318 [Chara braunii]
MEMESIPGAPPPPPPPPEIVMEDAIEETGQHTSQYTSHAQAQAEESATNGATAANAPEDCMRKVADWLMDSLQMKFTGRDDDFWDDTYRALIPLLKNSGSLKAALANGLPAGTNWQSICHKLLAIVINLSQTGEPQAASSAPSAMSSTIANSVAGNGDISETCKGDSQAGREKEEVASIDSQQQRGEEGDLEGGGQEKANKGREQISNQTEQTPNDMMGSGETHEGEGTEGEGTEGEGREGIRENDEQQAKRGRAEEREQGDHDSGRLGNGETQVGEGKQPVETIIFRGGKRKKASV